MPSLESTQTPFKLTGKKIRDFGFPILRIEKASPKLVLETPTKLLSLDLMSGREDCLMERRDGFSFWLATQEGYLMATQEGALYLQKGGALEELMAPKGWLEGWTSFKRGLCFWREEEVFSWDEAAGVCPVFKAEDAVIGVQYVPKRDILIISTGKRVYRIQGATLKSLGSKELPIYGSTFTACRETAAVALTCFEPCVLVAALESKQPLVMSGYEQRLSRLSWSQGGDRLVTASGTSLVTWRFDQGSPAGSRPFVFDGHVDRVSSLRCNKSYLFSGDKAGFLFVTSLLDPEQALAMGVDPVHSEITAICPDRDSKVFFAGQADGKLTYWAQKSPSMSAHGGL